MKKVFAILGVYIVLIFLCCIGITFIYRTVPNLIVSEITSYRVLRAFSWFFMLLPSVLLSGYTVACAVLWKAGTNNSKVRFSAAMVERYKIVVLSSIILVAVLAFTEEIFNPLVVNKIKRLESAPMELDEDLEKAQLFMDAEEYEISYVYAKRAVAIAPAEESAKIMLKKVKDALDVWQNQEVGKKYKVSADSVCPLYTQDHSYSAKELLQKAEDAVAAKEWFNAHYWSTLAIEACNEDDTNVDIAYAISEESWNELKKPEEFEDLEEYRIYREKQSGYIALNQGDYLKAYYILYGLQKKIPGLDPDVERYLALAKEAVENDYFFIDEADNMDILANGTDVYFSLVNPDGSKNVFYIKGIMDSRISGSDIRYLKDMTIVAYSSSGRFLRSVYVPLAKAISRNTDVFGQDDKASLGISKNWDSVPFIKMMAVDRDTQGIVSVPQFSDVETGLPDDLKTYAGLVDSGKTVLSSGLLPVYLSDLKNTIILPMSYSDFAVIDGASSGIETMSLLSLMHFIPSASKYGYAAETFSQVLLTRALYAILLLILFVIAAAVGWNYRIEDSNVMFKASWIYLILLYSAVMFLFVEVFQYIFKVINYVVVGFFGAQAMCAACILYIIVFIFVSMYFMSRKK